MTRRHCLLVPCLVLALTMAGPPSTRAADPPSRDPAVELHALFEDYFEELLLLDTVFASEIGDRRYDDRLENFLGEEHRQKERSFRERWLARIRSLDRTPLAKQDRLSYDIFERQQQIAIEALDFPNHLLPISQLFSVPSLFAHLGSGDGDHPFETEKNYRDFLARIDAWVPIAEQIVANLREGIARGVVQPKPLIEKALPQIESVIAGDVTQSIFYRPLLELPEALDPLTADALRQDYQTAIREKIVPSYARILEVLRGEYLPACRDSIGLSALPGGAAWYAHLVKTQTTTRLTPDEIHDIGLAEVDRVQGEMRAILREIGFEGDSAAFFAHLRADEGLYVSDPQDLLDAYGALRERVETALPRLFDLPLEAPLEIRPVPEFYAAAAPAAIYDPGAPDGSRPGVFWVNTHDLRARPIYQTEALFLHEAIPGHHYQASLARAAGDLPRFRRFVRVNAYLEGWGLYSESLGRELGLYTDPLMRFGRLDYEMLRALRLVVDTGIHARGWSRQRAIAYMNASSSLGESEVTAEVERYIAMPGQALSYKIGELALQRLRRQAEEALGDRFDVRAFHHQVLANGVLPLDVLERMISEWIAAPTSMSGTRPH